MSPTSHDLATCLRNLPLASKSSTSACLALYVFGCACMCLCACIHTSVFVWCLFTFDTVAWKTTFTFAAHGNICSVFMSLLTLFNYVHAYLAALTRMHPVVEAWSLVWAHPAVQVEGSDALLWAWSCSAHPGRWTGGWGQGVYSQQQSRKETTAYDFTRLRFESIQSYCKILLKKNSHYSLLRWEDRNHSFSMSHDSCNYSQQLVSLA